MTAATHDSVRLRALIAAAKRWDVIFVGLGIIALGIGLLTFAALFLDMLIDGWSRLRPEFFTEFPSRRAGQAGILSAWVGTTLVNRARDFAADVPQGEPPDALWFGGGNEFLNDAGQVSFVNSVQYPVFQPRGAAGACATCRS